MKSFQTIWMIILFFVTAEYAKNKAKHSTVSIASVDPIAWVKIDDSLFTNWSRINIPAGHHWIYVKSADAVHFQTKDFSKSVELNSGDDVRIAVNFEKVSEVNSYPMNATVTAGNNRLGLTPVYLSLSDFRGTDLILSKKNYEDLYLTITDSIITQGFASVSLIPRIKNSLNNENQFVNGQWHEQSTHRFKLPLIINTILSIASGAAAAYFKHKADDRFEQAKLARRIGDIALQDNLVNQTHKYDRESNIGFVVMQINMASLLYFLTRSK
jgi:hypothetical protein